MIYANDIGFSNIRVPNENSKLLYTYSEYNTFPEEVFVHEFLHDLERIEKNYGNEIPELHSYEHYGYIESKTEGLKKWYKDYMQSKIGQENIGLSKEVYTNKPVHNSSFLKTINLTEETFKEPENIVEDIKFLIEKVKEHINNIEIEGDYNNGSITV